MDDLAMFQKLIGVDAATLAGVVGIILFAVQGVKKYLPQIFKGGWKTQVVALIVSAVASMRLLRPGTAEEWFTFGMLAVFAWILAMGGKEIIMSHSNGGRVSRKTPGQ